MKTYYFLIGNIGFVCSFESVWFPFYLWKMSFPSSYYKLKLEETLCNLGITVKGMKQRGLFLKLQAFVIIYFFVRAKVRLWYNASKYYVKRKTWSLGINCSENSILKEAHSKLYFYNLCYIEKEDYIYFLANKIFIYIHRRTTQSDTIIDID